MQQIVIDSSVGVCWAMPDEFSLIADRALDRLANAEMLVPRLFWYELANVLIVNERRGRIDRERSAVALDKIERCNIIQTMPERNSRRRWASPVHTP